MIVPEVGRSVWYRPSEWDVNEGHMKAADAQPFHGVVVHVQNDRLVDLIVWDHSGIMWVRESTRLAQDGDIYPDNSGYAQWVNP